MRSKLSRLVVATAAIAGLAACGSARLGPPSSSVGASMDRTVPAAIEDLPLLDREGHHTSLAAYRGKVLVIADFLTSCQEECPITTGALEDMQRDTEQAGLGSSVVFTEISVDPGRDSPSRLAAYIKLTGVGLDLLTGSPASLAALWHYFGIYYQKVPEDNPPGLDWETGQPYTYDVDHSDGFLIIDGTGHERFLTAGMPDLHGQLAPNLTRLLDSSGRQNLTNPGGDSWTVADGLSALSWVVGRTIPAQSKP